MTHRAAPGVIAGCLGLVLAVLAMVTEQVWLAGAAGVAALVSGLFTLGLADRLHSARTEAEDATAEVERARAESEGMAARAAYFEAEALRARVDPGDDPGRGDDQAASGPAGIIDEETGLFNGAFFSATLDHRVAAARRGLRPLALALLEPTTDVAGGNPRPAVRRAVADCLVATLRDSDIACRLDTGLIALILEDTPENGAVWTVERVRRNLDASTGDVTLRAGVACYPAHAFGASELLQAARTALDAARDWQQDRIEVAAVPED